MMTQITSFFILTTIKSDIKKIAHVCQLIRDFSPNWKAIAVMIPINPARNPLITTLTDLRCFILS
jgi:hypothetical protein